GLRLWLLRATSSTDMSERTNRAISRPKAAAVSAPCATLAGRTSDARSFGPPRRNSAPATSERQASAAAIHKSARPSSAIIVRLANMGRKSASFPRHPLHVLRHLAHLWRHVALVMLGENPVGHENTVGAHATVGD